MRCQSHPAVRLALLPACILLALRPSHAHAGKLDSFERSVRSGPATPSTSHDSSDDCLADFFAQVFSDIFSTCIAEGGRTSIDRIPSVPDGLDVSSRCMGEPLIPFVAIEPAWQMLRSDIEGLDVQAEVGYGPVAIHGRFTQYREEEPDDRLNVIRASLLYRMSIGEGLEIDLGIGALFLDGQQELTRFSFMLPVRLHPGGPVGFEFRPAWSENLADYDVALYLTVQNVSLKGGYRWLNSPDESLNGPYVGLSLRL